VQEWGDIGISRRKRVCSENAEMRADNIKEGGRCPAN
jgi:hypothetical protein